MPSAHYFFALALPSEVKRDLHALSESIQKEFPFKKWVHPEDYHITLAFLGHAPEPMLNEAIYRTGLALADTSSFPLTINGTGTFGSRQFPRILWAGTNQSNSLQLLQEKVYAACTNSGFQLDKKPFKSHITLARKWTGESPFSSEPLNQHVASIEPNQFSAAEVVLYQTHPKRMPKYEIKEAFKLL